MTTHHHLKKFLELINSKNDNRNLQTIGARLEQLHEWKEKKQMGEEYANLLIEVAHDIHSILDMTNLFQREGDDYYLSLIPHQEGAENELLAKARREGLTYSEVRAIAGRVEDPQIAQKIKETADRREFNLKWRNGKYPILPDFSKNVAMTVDHKVIVLLEIASTPIQNAGDNHFKAIGEILAQLDENFIDIVHLMYLVKFYQHYPTRLDEINDALKDKDLTYQGANRREGLDVKIVRCELTGPKGKLEVGIHDAQNNREETRTIEVDRRELANLLKAMLPATDQPGQLTPLNPDVRPSLESLIPPDRILTIRRLFEIEKLIVADSQARKRFRDILSHEGLSVSDKTESQGGRIGRIKAIKSDWSSLILKDYDLILPLIDRNNERVRFNLAKILQIRDHLSQGIVWVQEFQWLGELYLQDGHLGWLGTILKKIERTNKRKLSLYFTGDEQGTGNPHHGRSIIVEGIDIDRGKIRLNGVGELQIVGLWFQLKQLIDLEKYSPIGRVIDEYKKFAKNPAYSSSAQFRFENGSGGIYFIHIQKVWKEYIGADIIDAKRKKWIRAYIKAMEGDQAIFKKDLLEALECLPGLIELESLLQHEPLKRPEGWKNVDEAGRWLRANNKHRSLKTMENYISEDMGLKEFGLTDPCIKALKFYWWRFPRVMEAPPSMLTHEQFVAPPRDSIQTPKAEELPINHQAHAEPLTNPPHQDTAEEEEIISFLKQILGKQYRPEHVRIFHEFISQESPKLKSEHGDSPSPNIIAREFINYLNNHGMIENEK